MRLSDIKVLKSGERTAVCSFSGIDRRSGISGSVLKNTENMTSSAHPALSVRNKRRIITECESGNGVICADEVAWCDGTSFFYGDTEYSGAVTDTEKQLALINSKIVIFPDKKYYDTASPGIKALGYDTVSLANKIDFRDGTLYGAAATANEMYTYGQPFPEGLKAGDAVEIYGCITYPANNITAVIIEVSPDRKSLRFHENIFTTGRESGEVGIRRSIPDMDFVFECRNRLMGCKGDTVYVSALGDPGNFGNYDVPGTGAYTVDVSGFGDFTGACAYGGYPYFFKEGRVWKLYGGKPSDYELIDVADTGVAAGSGRSLAVCGGRLFYLSRAGVCVFGGGAPTVISGPLGEIPVSAVAGSDGVRYYMSAHLSGETSLFTYDIGSGAWYREDSSDAVAFAGGSGLYMLTENALYELTGTATGGSEESDIPFMLETSPFFGGHGELSAKRAPSRIALAARLGAGTYCEVYISYDGGGYISAGRLAGSGGERVKRFPLTVRECDCFSLRLKGIGEFTLSALEYTV